MNKAVSLLALLSLQQPPYTSGPRVSSPHRLEGWVESYVYPTLEKYGPLPTTLVLSRSGHLLSRFGGNPFLWTWIFVDNGKRVAYEAGPLHGGMLCLLADVHSGKELARYDCFFELPVDAPEWVKALQLRASSSNPR